MSLTGKEGSSATRRPGAVELVLGFGLQESAWLEVSLSSGVTLGTVLEPEDHRHARGLWCLL